MFGLTAAERTGKYAKVRIFNHEWERSETFKQIGVISADEIEVLTGGLLRMDVPVTINKKLWEYDQVIICGRFRNKQKGLLFTGTEGKIFDAEWLMFKNAEGISRPNRTAAKDYYGGYSDHLPVYIDLILKK